MPIAAPNSCTAAPNGHGPVNGAPSPACAGRLGPVLDAALLLVAKTLDTAGALLVARSSERDQPVRAHHGLPPGEALRLFRLLDSPVARILLCSAKPFLLPDGPQTDGDATAAGGTDVALIVTPLPAEGRPTGALAVRQGRNTSLDQAWVREFLLDTARLLVRLLELDPAAPAPTHDPLVPPAASPPDPAAAPEVPHTLRDLEKSEVIAALRRNGFVQYKAARELGLTMRQMGYRVRKFGLATLIASERRPRAAKPAQPPSDAAGPAGAPSPEAD
jgi:hypothetical protein